MDWNLIAIYISTVPQLVRGKRKVVLIPQFPSLCNLGLIGRSGYICPVSLSRLIHSHMIALYISAYARNSAVILVNLLAIVCSTGVSMHRPEVALNFAFICDKKRCETSSGRTMLSIKMSKLEDPVYSFLSGVWGYSVCKTRQGCLYSSFNQQSGDGP